MSSTSWVFVFAVGSAGWMEVVADVPSCISCFILSSDGIVFCTSVIALLMSVSVFLVITACVSVTICLVLSLITDCMFFRSSAVALSSSSSRNVFLRSVRSEAFAVCFTCVSSFLTRLSRSIYFCAILCTSETTPIAAGLQWLQYQLMAVFSFDDKNS